MLNIVWSLMVRKDEVKPVIFREGKDGKYRYSCTLSLTFALDGGRVVNTTPRSLYSRECPLPTVRVWMGPGRLMVGWLMYDDLKKKWKRRVVACLSYYPSICPEGLKKL